MSKRRRREGTGDAGRRAPPPRAEWGLDPQAWSYLRLTAADVHRLEVHDRNLFVMAGTQRPVVRVEVCGIVVLTETKSHDKVLIYYIDDGTALISCTQFLSNEEGSRKSDTVTYGLGRRVRVRGKLKCVTRGDDYVGGESERSDSGGGVGVGGSGSSDGGASAKKATVAFELADIAITSISPNDELLHMVTGGIVPIVDDPRPLSRHAATPTPHHPTPPHHPTTPPPHTTPPPQRRTSLRPTTHSPASLLPDTGEPWRY